LSGFFEEQKHLTLFKPEIVIELGKVQTPSNFFYSKVMLSNFFDRLGITKTTTTPLTLDVFSEKGIAVERARRWLNLVSSKNPILKTFRN
jgi:hypothetical protein